MRMENTQGCTNIKIPIQQLYNEKPKRLGKAMTKQNCLICTNVTKHAKCFKRTNRFQFGILSFLDSYCSTLTSCDILNAKCIFKQTFKKKKGKQALILRYEFLKFRGLILVVVKLAKYSSRFPSPPPNRLFSCSSSSRLTSKEIRLLLCRFLSIHHSQFQHLYSSPSIREEDQTFQNKGSLYNIE